MRPSRRVRAACCCIASLAAFCPVHRAKADPDNTSPSRRAAAIVNEPLGEAVSSHPKLEKGSTGDLVLRVQKLLNRDRRNRGAGTIAEDRIFGDETEKALRAFQRKRGLEQTGVTDLLTWHELESFDAATTRAAAPGAATPAPSETIGIAHALDRATNPRAMKLSAESLDVLARIIEAEAGVCSLEGKIAVGAVVLNRVRAGFDDGTVFGVVSSPSQFTAYDNATYRSTPSGESREAARRAAAGEDPSHRALYYYNPYLVSPGWARSMRVLARIGTDETDTHVFLKP